MAILLPDRIDVATFGEFLRDARERRGLTLQQIARKPDPWRHLDALEHGNLDAVPAGCTGGRRSARTPMPWGSTVASALAQFEHALESSDAQETDEAVRPAADGRARIVVDGPGRHRRRRRGDDVRGVALERPVQTRRWGCAACQRRAVCAAGGACCVPEPAPLSICRGAGDASAGARPMPVNHHAGRGRRSRSLATRQRRESRGGWHRSRRDAAHGPEPAAASGASA